MSGTEIIEGAPASGMITRAAMFEAMLVADPAFEPTWREFVEEWKDDPELPQYLVLGDLARHLIARLERGETDVFGAVFEVVERWHVDGEHYVQEAATIGLLEQLQNTYQHKGSTGPGDFLPWLGPVTRSWWDRLERFWDGDIMALREE